MNYKTMKTEELQMMKKGIEHEIKQRSPNLTTGKVEYMHTCYGEPAYHFVNSEHWAKLVQIIDSSRDWKDAFIGRYLYIEERYMLPVNSIIVEVCDESISAFKLTNAGKICILKGQMHQLYGFIEDLERLFYGD